MIEIIYNESKKGTTGNEEIFNIPNNIRQIGENKGHQKIYMEDYAYTFLKRMSREDTETGCAAILLGEAKWKDSTSYIFIRSALKIEEAEITAEHMPFSDLVWGEIHKDIEKFFPDQEIIGWVLSLPGFNMNINDIIQRTHLDHFAGSQKTLFVMEPIEKEEAFYFYDNNQLIRQAGYYIYYEKNEPMQSYMIEKNGNSSIEETEHASDRAVLDFRKIVSGKKEEQKTEGTTKRLLYGASACCMIALLAFGITFFNNYSNMKSAVSKVSNAANQEQSESASVEPAQETTVPMPDAATDSAAAETEQTENTDKSDQNTSTENNSQSITNPNTNSGGNKTAQETAADEELPENTSMETPAVKQQDSSASNSDSQETDKNSTAKQSESAAETDNENQPDTQKKAVSTMGNQRYVVRKGDTLTQISETYYGTIRKIDEICDANELSADDIIYEGQIILLP